MLHLSIIETKARLVYESFNSDFFQQDDKIEDLSESKQMIENYLNINNLSFVVHNQEMTVAS